MKTFTVYVYAPDGKRRTYPRCTVVTSTNGQLYFRNNDRRNCVTSLPWFYSEDKQS